MGLLDMTPEQNSGLLQFGLSMLAGGGPSPQPRNFGQIFAGSAASGLSAMDQFRARQMQEAQQKQIAEMRDLQLQEIRRDVAAREQAARQFGLDNEAVRNAFMPATGGMAMANGQGPTEANAQNIGRTQRFDPRAFLAQNPQASLGALKQGMEMDKAFNPSKKVDAWKEVTVDGKVMYAPYFEDGTFGQPVPMEAAKALHFQNTGGKTIAVNPITGKPMTEYQNTVSPDTQYSGGITMRGQNMTDARAQQALAAPQFHNGQLIYRPDAMNPTGRAVTPAGMVDTKAPPEAFNKAATGLVEMKNSISNYEKVIQELGGTRVIPGTPNAARLKAAFTAAQMGVKNAMELGALAGPDLDILSGFMIDPTSPKGLMLGANGVARQISEAGKYISGKRDAVEKSYGRKVPGFDASPEAGIDDLLAKYGAK